MDKDITKQSAGRKTDKIYQNFMKDFFFDSQSKNSQKRQEANDGNT